MAQTGESTENKSFRTFWDARIEWPPDMPDDMLEDAINTAKEASKKYDIEQDGQKVVKFIKNHFDEKWEPYWHVIMGKNYGT
jgi:dynein light chain LC8-type